MTSESVATRTNKKNSARRVRDVLESLGLAELGAEKVRMADADMVRAATGYAIGGVSPFDLPEGLQVLVDDSLARFDLLYPAAGTPQSIVRLTRELLLRTVRGRVARVTN